MATGGSPDTLDLADIARSLRRGWKWIVGGLLTGRYLKAVQAAKAVGKFLRERAGPLDEPSADEGTDRAGDTPQPGPRADRGGAVGSLPCAMLSADAVREQVTEVRPRAAGPINLNFFCHKQPANPDDSAWRSLLRPYYAEYGIEPTDAAR